MDILVTAFDPFGGESVNPAQQAMNALPATLEGATLHKLVVPTVFGTATAAVVAAMDSLCPAAVVCVGQAGGRAAITPERVAINVMDASIPDNAGRQPVDEPVEQGGPAALFSTLPVKDMVAAIRAAGLPAELSNTAGTFVCNSLLYGVLRHAQLHHPDTKCAFVHVPFLPRQAAGKEGVPSLPLEDIVRGLEAALRAVVSTL